MRVEFTDLTDEMLETLKNNALFFNVINTMNKQEFEIKDVLKIIHDICLENQGLKDKLVDAINKVPQQVIIRR